ncbi:MAG: BlaI/MecI/CopY family transcriptional regulator [Phycisphaeraceae bacterium]|nr:BlaI/MecI/CopY family transcriptional regulator [Phycisphaeraceae bacterium]
MSKPSKNEIRVGRLELQIMNVVWDKGQATVHEVKDVLSQGRPPAYTTILTMMRKLEAKGYLKHEVDTRTYVYQAAIKRQEVRQGLLGDLMDRIFAGSPSLLVTSLLEQDHISEEELDEIHTILKMRGRAK